MTDEKPKLDDKQKRRLGLQCPDCGCEDLRDESGRFWDTVKTIHIPGAVRRYKVCRHCGRKIRTKEILEK